VFDKEGNNIYKYDLDQKENRTMLRKLRTKTQINKNIENKNKNKNKSIPDINDIEGYISNDDFDKKDQEVYDTKKGKYIFIYYHFYSRNTSKYFLYFFFYLHRWNSQKIQRFFQWYQWKF